MGYDVHRFVGTIDDKFVCVICTMVLEDPVQSMKCEHTFCNVCIVKWLAINKTCPLDRGSMCINDMMPFSVLMRTFLDQLEIKCDFESNGCNVPIKLHTLKDHVKQCRYNPNLIVACDKGCGLQMTFNDYESANCFTHLANLVLAQQKQIALLMKTRTIWQKCNGFKIRNSDPTLLRHIVGHHLSFAQSVYSLDRDNCYFEVNIVDLGDGNKMSIGLTDNKYPINKHPGYVKTSIGHHGYDGRLYVNSETGNVFGVAWQKDDTIGCGVKFGPENNLPYETVRVYFTKNSEIIGERKITLFHGEMFPSIGIESSSATVRFTSF